MAHELHHIGLASVAAEMEAALKDLPPPARTAAEWMGAFGEGIAMLAAAGRPDVHPHAHSSPEDRARWDHDRAGFSRDLPLVERFFLDSTHASVAGVQPPPLPRPRGAIAPARDPAERSTL